MKQLLLAATLALSLATPAGAMEGVHSISGAVMPGQVR